MRRLGERRFVNKKSKSTKHNNINTDVQSISQSFSDKMTDYVEDEPEVKMEFFGHVSTLINPCLLLITPNSTIDFTQSLLPRLQRIAQNYQKEEAIAFIQENLKVHQIYNVTNLLSIEDEYFWNNALPRLFKLLVKELPKLECKFDILYVNIVQSLIFTRLDIFILLSSMLLGIMPKQYLQQCVTLGELMTYRDRDTQQKGKLMNRREKLKCLLAYFKTMINNPSLFNEEIHIRRVSNKNIDQFKNNSRFNPKINLRKVTIRDSGNGHIEDYCGNAIVTNHANKCVGFAATKNGMNKQDILFSIFPELISIKLLCQQLSDHQAIAFYGARRFARHTGENKHFEFVQEQPLQNKSEVENSVIVSIDAANYNRYSFDQFSRIGICREINKAFVGFNAAELADAKMAVCTGKWGCGSNGGDEVLKFLIQWIAASKAKRDMVYVVNSEQKITQYRLLVQELFHFQALDLLSLLFEYCQRRKVSSTKASLLEFLKYYI